MYELLQIKEKIISDKEYRTWMQEISNVEKEFAISSEFNNKVALDHGIHHMDRVANNLYNLLKEYNCDKHTCFLGYITGLVHDIGMIKGKKGHAENGSNLAKVFLKKFDFINAEDILKITNAIKNHGDGGKKPDELTAFLAISDKADMCKARSLGNLSPIQFIDEYKLKLEKDVLELRYIISNNKGKEGLYIIPKSIDIPNKLGSELGLKVEFYINGKIEDFKDRENFKGRIYIRKE